MSAFCDRKVFCYKGFTATGCGTDNVKCVAMSDEDKNMMLDGGGRRKLTSRIKSKKNRKSKRRINKNRKSNRRR